MNEEILKRIREVNPKLASEIGDILAQKLVKAIYCNSKTCKGRLIGYLDDKGNPVETDDDKLGIMGVRPRMDGYLGFQCICGNDSRVCKAEKGIIKVTKPTKNDIEKVFKNLESMKTEAIEKEKSITVDGFTIKEL